MASLHLDEPGKTHFARVGAPAPDFTLKTQQSDYWRLADHKGVVVVLLFYPQNETLVCTRQLCSVRDNWEDYLETKALIVGISAGTPAEHRTFSQHHQLPITLLADGNRRVMRRYCGHWLYPVGLTRGVVIIDANGIVRNIDVMLRAFRPTDAQLITEIYAARGDAFSEKYKELQKAMPAGKRN